LLKIRSTTYSRRTRGSGQQHRATQKEIIVAAIKDLKNQKALGHDQLNAGLIKADPELASNLFLPLFVTIWKEIIIPEDWYKGTIVKIIKKGDLNNCNNSNSEALPYCRSPA